MHVSFQRSSIHKHVCLHVYRTHRVVDKYYITYTNTYTPHEAYIFKYRKLLYMIISFLSLPFAFPPPLLPHIGLDFWIPSTSILNPDQLLVSAAREIPAMPASCYPLGESLKAHDLSCSSRNGFPGNSRPPPRTNRGVGAAP